MINMIERVAVAINQAMLLHDDYDPDLLARAAIAAMREPTPEMNNTVNCYRIEEALTGYNCTVADVWRDMIDAALECSTKPDEK